MRRLGLLLGLLFAPAAASAQASYGRCVLATLLNDVALNGAAATRTFTIAKPTTNAPGTCALVDSSGRSYRQLNLFLKFTHANNGTLSTSCTFSPDAGTNDYEPTTCDVSSGTCTLAFAGTWTTPSLSAAKKYTFPVTILGYSHIECVTTHGGAPNASDKLHVIGELAN